MFHPKYVSVQTSNNLFAFLRQLQVAERFTDVRINAAPVELRVALQQVARMSVAQKFSSTAFFQLVKQRAYFLQILRVAELTYQVSATN